MLRLKAGQGFPEALALLGTALQQYLRAGDEASAGLVHSRIGGALCLHHSVTDIPRALEHFDAAEHLLPAPEAVYHLHRGRSHAAMLGLRTPLLAESSARAASIATAAGRRDLAVVAGWARGWAAANEGRLADSAEIWEQGWRTAHEMADPYLGWLPVNAAALLSNAYLLDPRAARSWCRRGLGQPRFTSFAHPHGAVVDQLALALAAMGEVDGAHEAVEHLPLDAGARRMLAYLDGEWERAADSWAAAAAADESAGDLHDAALNHRWLASARAALGDGEGAVAALERSLVLACQGPQLPTELDARAMLAHLLAAGAARRGRGAPGALRRHPGRRGGLAGGRRAGRARPGGRRRRSRRRRPRGCRVGPRRGALRHVPPAVARGRCPGVVGTAPRRPWTASGGRGAMGAGAARVCRHPRRRPVDPAGGLTMTRGPRPFHAPSTPRRHGGSTHRPK